MTLRLQDILFIILSELIKIDRKKLTKFDQIQLMKYSHYIIDPCLLK